MMIPALPETYYMIVSSICAADDGADGDDDDDWWYYLSFLCEDIYIKKIDDTYVLLVGPTVL